MRLYANAKLLNNSDRREIGVDLCLSRLQVDLYGFMTEDYKKYSNYYYDKAKTDVIFYANHDYTLEKNLWSQLHKDKIIKLYQRTDAEAQTEKPKQH